MIFLDKTQPPRYLEQCGGNHQRRIFEMPQSSARRPARKFTDSRLLAALKHTHGNAAAAARRLKVSPAIVSARLSAMPGADFPEIVLWYRLRHRPSRTDIRNQLTERYLPLVRHIAFTTKAKLPWFMDLQPLVSAGNLGLLGAICGYDHTRGIKFSSYAFRRIQGAIFDDLRQTDPTSRLTRTRQAHREQAAYKLSQTLGRQPTTDETRAALGWTPQQYHASLPMRVGSLHVISRDDDDEAIVNIDVAARPSPTNSAARAVAMSRATRGLPFESRIVVYLSYAKSRTLKQIGEVMGFSESRSSQIRDQALRWLRDHKTREELLEVLF